MSEKTDRLVDAVKAVLPSLSAEARVDLLNAMFEDWCKLCGAKEPCYCASCYDE